MAGHHLGDEKWWNPISTHVCHRHPVHERIGIFVQNISERGSICTDFNLKNLGFCGREQEDGNEMKEQTRKEESRVASD